MKTKEGSRCKRFIWIEICISHLSWRRNLSFYLLFKLLSPDIKHNIEILLIRTGFCPANMQSNDSARILHLPNSQPFVSGSIVSQNILRWYKIFTSSFKNIYTLVISVIQNMSSPSTNTELSSVTATCWNRFEGKEAAYDQSVPS